MMPIADIIPPDIRPALQNVDQDAAHIIDSFFKTIEVLPWPPTIYHYTNDIGLRGILETGKLWLTDMFNLNDPSELSHSLSHMADTLNNKAVNGPPESKIFSQAFEAYLKQGYQKVAHYFICSFSAVGDDLGQWRAYADNGRGYALGFDAGELVAAFKNPSGKPVPNNGTFPMTYNDSKSIELHKKIVEKMFHLISLPHNHGLESAVVRAYENHLYALLAMESSRIGLVFKHEAYKNEKEFRFVGMHSPDVLSADVKFRSRPYSIVKYREFDWRSAAPGVLK